MINPLALRSPRVPAPSTYAPEKDARKSGAPERNAPKTFAQAVELQNAPPGARITDVKESPGGGRSVTVEVPAASPAASPFAALDRVKAEFAPPPAFAPKTGQFPEPRSAFGAVRPEEISTFTAGASGETGGKLEIGGFVAAGAVLSATDGPWPVMDVLGLAVVKVGATLHGLRDLAALGKDANVMPSISRKDPEDDATGLRPDLLPDPGVDQIDRDRARPRTTPRDPSLADPRAGDPPPFPGEEPSGREKPLSTPREPVDSRDVGTKPFPPFREERPLSDARLREADEPGGKIEPVIRTGTASLNVTERLMGDAPKTEEEKLAVVDEYLKLSPDMDGDETIALYLKRANRHLQANLGDKANSVDANGRGWAALSPSELAVAQLYVLGGYTAMNDSLRGNYGTDAFFGTEGVSEGKQVRLGLQLASILLGAQDRIPLRSGIFQRGEDTPIPERQKYLPGTIVQTSSFMSASTDGNPSSFGEEPVQFIIRGTAWDLTGLNSDENEVVFPPGTQFRVLEKTWVEGQRVIYLQQLE